MTDNTYQRRFEGVWIPRDVWLSKDLTLQEKVMLVEVSSLSKGENGCYANNRYFADFFGLSVSRVSEVISSLESKGYISIKRHRNGAQKESRNIFVVNRIDPSGYRKHPSENRIDPSGKAKDNSTLNSTDKDIGKEPSFTDQCKEVIDYLNLKAGTSFRLAESHKRGITARLKEGATVDEMKRVIDAKCAEWLNDSRMKKYLRPITLFAASNYDNYVGALPSEYQAGSSVDSDDFMMGV